MSTKAFGPKIFSRDASQGIRIDSKRGGFVDRTRPCETQSDRLTQNYSIFLRPELLNSFQEDLHNCSEVAKSEKRYKISVFFAVFVLFRFIAETKVQILIYIDELNLFTRMQASMCLLFPCFSFFYFVVLDIHF